MGTDKGYLSGKLIKDLKRSYSQLQNELIPQFSTVAVYKKTFMQSHKIDLLTNPQD